MLKWWWLWQAVSLTQFPTPPTLPILLPHALFLGQFTLYHDFWFVGFSCRGSGRFWVSRRFSSSPHELLSTHELQNRVFPVVCASTGKNGAVFLHAGPPLSVIFLAGSDCLPTRRYSSVWGAHSELRAVILHPRLTVKGHSRFWLSHRLVGSFFPVVVCLLLCFWGCAIRFPCFKL